jgi:hypothetical protein
MIQFSFHGQDVQRRLPALPFQPLHSSIESCLEFSISAGCDMPYLKGAAKFVERLPDYLLSLLWITRLVILVNRQLLVSLIANCRVRLSKTDRPARNRLRALRALQGTPRLSIGFGRQKGCNRL